MIRATNDVSGNINPTVTIVCHFNIKMAVATIIVVIVASLTCS